MVINGRRIALVGALILGVAVTVPIVAAAGGGEPATWKEPRVVTSRMLGAPEDVAFDADGNLYFSEFEGNRIDEVTPGGDVVVIAGTGEAGYGGDGGPATEATLNEPTGLFFEPSGALLVADHRNGCIRRIDTSGIISRVVGRCGHEGFSGDEGPARKARLDDPIGIVEDADGNLFIADEQNHRVREVTTDGVIHTVAGGGTHPVRNARGGIQGTELLLRHPSYLALSPTGGIVFSDFWANVVMKLDAKGRAWHVAGTGKPGFTGDGGPAVDAQLDFPTGVAFGPDGELYISETDFADPTINNRIRVVAADGAITTVVGTGASGYSGDGGPALLAEITAPSGLGVDPTGRLVIADQGNDVVRRVNLAGLIRTVASRSPLPDLPKAHRVARQASLPNGHRRGRRSDDERRLHTRRGAGPGGTGRGADRRGGGSGRGAVAPPEAGCSVTLVKLDDELVSLLAAPAEVASRVF